MEKNPNDHRPKYLIQTFGCQMNSRDSEVLAGILESSGYLPAEDEQQADLIILNTCTVRKHADDRILGRLGELKALKKISPTLKIAVGGCMGQRKDASRQILKHAPHVDLIFGTHNIHELPEMLQRINDKRNLIEVWDEEREIVENLPSVRGKGIRAYVSIMYGCDNFCSYCIVPYVRGRERSRQPEEIKNEVIKLVQEGYKEIMLLGQNVNSYGKGLAPDLNFATLLEYLDEIEELKRIRYMTSHPKDFSLQTIRVIANSSKVCQHFHLPVQAGSDRILKLMNRQYTREQYLDLLAQVRSICPEASITTDIIVGFPGETDEDFAETLDLVKRAKFDAAFTFVYSPRSGTPASEIEDNCSADLKKERLQQLMQVQNEVSLELNRDLVGKSLEVMVEGLSKTSDLFLTGRTRTNKIVIFEGQPEDIGQELQIKITHANTWTLRGLVEK